MIWANQLNYLKFVRIHHYCTIILIDQVKKLLSRDQNGFYADEEKNNQLFSHEVPGEHRPHPRPLQPYFGNKIANLRYELTGHRIREYYDRGMFVVNLGWLSKMVS